MKHFRLAYTLRDGSRGVLHVLTTSSCAAIVIALDTLGDTLRTCSARLA